MKIPSNHTSFCVWTIIFLHFTVQIICVAPSIPDLYSIPRLTEANISRRMLVDLEGNCPLRCLCSLLANKIMVDCSDKQIQSIPPKIHMSTFELLLSKNRITTLSYHTNLHSLEALNASNNAITKLDKEWLTKLVNLKSLDISKNSLQSGGIENIFYNLSLQYLNLSYNNLDEISKTMFHEMKLLQELDLSNNEIYKINYDSFNSLVSLMKLDLSFNKIFQIKHEWFKNLKKLKTLFLEGNNLQLLSNVVFSPLNGLQYLDLSRNEISSIGLLSFKGLLNLITLNISNNRISLLQEGVFRPLQKVEVIDLSNNPLKVFDRSFKHAESVKILYMKSLSNLTTLTAASLSGLTHVEIIDLSGSKSLSNINQFAFTSTKNLRSLDISNSNLKSLKNGVFKELTKVESIKLKGNPWRCNCYLYWLLLWLGENANTQLLSPSESFCDTPLKLKGHILLDALDHNMVCTNASIYKYTKKAKFRVGSTALLHCQAKGTPLPVITWITPWKMAFQWVGTQNGTFISGSSENGMHAEIHSSDNEMSEFDNERFLLMKNGDLLIRNVERGDGGFYVCVASNPLGNHSIAIRLTLDYEYLTHIKIVSILVGLATSFGFLLLTLISVLIKMILKRCGVKCPCRSGTSSPKSQQIRKILESMEHYKKQQLERLRDNYNFQVQRIKDNCMQQMERLRESYSSQAERLRDIRDYGTLQIDRIRENYYFQVQRVRDYSTSQIEKLRENYIFQRNRIRKFSAHHLYKLRENYKLQQQHLNKILENLNIESCRNVCQRTDSIVFEPDITLENVFVPKICLSQSFSTNNCDSVDNSSQISAYFTPEEAGSELSEHETDVQDSASNDRHISNLDIHDDVEITDKTNFVNFSNPDADILPNVAIFCNSELHANTNETIV